MDRLAIVSDPDVTVEDLRFTDERISALYEERRQLRVVRPREATPSEEAARRAPAKKRRG